MFHKRVLRPDRLRQVPAQFSWIDQRFVRERHIERCSLAALALYLLLNVVADAQGLSYYGDATVCRCLSIDQATLERTRAELLALGLIAYQRPLYQVLSFDPPPAPHAAGVRPAYKALAALRSRLERNKA